MLRRRKKTEDSGPSKQTSGGASAQSQRPASEDRPLKNPAGKLGEILLGEGIITPAQLQEALNKKRDEGGFLGQNLIELGFINQDTLTTFLVKQCKIPHLNLMDYQIDESVVALVDHNLCEEHGVLPIDKMGKILTLAMVDPLDLDALEAIRAHTPELKIKPILCDWDDFQNVFNRLFPDEEVEDSAEEATAEHFDLPKQTPPRAKTPEQPKTTQPVEDTSGGETAAPATPPPAPALEASAPTPDQQTLAPGFSGEELASLLHASIANGLREVLPALREELAAMRQPAAATPLDERLGHLVKALESMTANVPVAAAPSNPSDEGPSIAAITTALEGSVRQGVEAAIERIAKNQGPSPEALAETIQSSITQAVSQLREAVQPSTTSDGAGLEAKLEELAQHMQRLAEASELIRAAHEQERENIAAAAQRERDDADARARQGVRPFPIEAIKAASGAKGDGDVLKALESGAPMAVYSLDEFLPGEANAVAYGLATAVAAAPGTEYNPLYVSGPVGLGKTHLINAIGNRIVETLPELRVGYTSASRFASLATDAAEHRRLREFREIYCRWDVLILDDIQFLAGDVTAQEEFFHIFNTIQQEGRQIIIAGDQPPEQLGLLEKRLVSRFAGGIVGYLNPPEWETRVAILRRQVEKAGLKVPEEVLALVAMRITNDIRRLTGALLKLAAHSKVKGHPITLQLTAEVLAQLGAEEAA